MAKQTLETQFPGITQVQKNIFNNLQLIVNKGLFEPFKPMMMDGNLTFTWTIPGTWVTVFVEPSGVCRYASSNGYVSNRMLFPEMVKQIEERAKL